MPFTPFHMGPGAAFKLVGSRWFSFTIFGLSQILIDVEVLIRMLRNSSTLHGFSNTYLGATVIGIVTVLAGKPVCEFFLNLWNKQSPSRWLKAPASWFKVPARISWRVAAISAFLGVYSHVLLDSIMHTDAEPWAPFSEANGMLRLISVRELHLFCVYSGAIGAVGLLGVWLWRKRRSAGG